MKMIRCGLGIKKYHVLLVNHFHGNFRSKTFGCQKIKSVVSDVKWCFNASWGLKGLLQFLTEVVDMSFAEGDPLWPNSANCALYVQMWNDFMPQIEAIWRG